MNGTEAKLSGIPDAVAASCMNFGKKAYVRLSRKTPRKYSGFSRMRAISPPAPSFAGAAGEGGVDLAPCNETATCRKMPDRKMDAMNRAAKFLMLRWTRS